MNIQAKSKSPRSINWKQIAIIAVVLGIAGFKYFNSQRDAALLHLETAAVPRS